MRVLYAFVVLAASATVVQVDGYLDVLSDLNDCGSTDLDACLERRLAQTMDEVLDKNETYRLNRYLTVTAVGNRLQHPASDELADRFLDFFNALQIQYQPEEDDESTDDVFEGTTSKQIEFCYKIKRINGIKLNTDRCPTVGRLIIYFFFNINFTLYCFCFIHICNNNVISPHS